jgi:outer membrane protein OmpA-like peptidoglycan-associated protein
MFALLAAAIVAAQERNFVACPIVRDTKTVPCFLAEYDGELYFLGIQQDITAEFHPPQLKHKVLVEGHVAQGPRVCGGIPLKPLSISTLKEVDLACDTLLPAEPGIEAPPAARGAGPASHPLSTELVTTEPAPPAETVTGRQEFTVLFAFDDDYVEFGSIGTVRRAAAYATAPSGRGSAAVRVTGYRGTSLLSNGERLVEKPGLAEKRAKAIATLLEGLGVAAVHTDWKMEREPADGKTDPSRRRVTIEVIR